MLNKDLADEFHHGINDISKYREVFEDKPEYDFGCFSWLLVGIELFLGITGILFSLFRK